ncbi:MAG: DNA repair protein RadC [Ignavibacteriales bacterium]|nr:DNA repair protein RadC [Ignavibacteriales bacterium]
MKLKDLPLDERPREKLLMKGIESLSETDLIAILLRTGFKGKSVLKVARELLEKYGNLALLATKSVEELSKNKGIGKSKAIGLSVAFELGRRIEYQNKWFSNTKITSPKDIAEICIPILRDEIKEKFLVACLNSSNKIIKFAKVSEGSLNSNVVYPREVFKIAIENDSANIILIHNHPSGNIEPSEADIQITKKLVEAGKILEIKVFDHIIIAGNKYLSMVEKSLVVL